MTISSNDDVSLNWMRAGLEKVSEGFALFDDQDELVYCNTAFKQLHPDLVRFLEPGFTWSLFLVEAQRSRLRGDLEKLDSHLTSGINTEMSLETSNPGNRWYRMGLHPIDSGGFVLTETDITDQRQAHDIIEHADDLLRDILDACASRIVLFRLNDGKILYRTPAWRESFGELSNIKAIFQKPVDYADLLADLLATARVDDRDDTMLHQSGHLFPTRVSARTIEYQDEPAVVMSIEDMTQLHAQRNEIVQTNQRLLDAIEALDQGFVLFDSKHQLVMANQHYKDVNQPIADAVKKGAHNLDLIKHSKNKNHEPLAAGWPNIVDEPVSAKYDFELADNRSFSVSRRYTSDGGFVITWRDVTEQRANELELFKRREAAFQNEKLAALGQLLAGVAHELNNPLSVVLGHAMMLKEEVSDADVLEGLEKISLSAERCAKIVKTFLALARQKPIQLEQFNINEIIELALEISSYGMRKSGVKVDLHLAENLPYVSIDEDQVIQVFINLMINAEHALNNVDDFREYPTPVLKITTAYDSLTDQVVVYVSDNGPGIAEDQKLRIFEPFFTTKAVGEGTGVGLALSHRIINSHGGDLSVSDSEMGGATFKISLPICTEIPNHAEQQPQSLAINAVRALLIEDEPDVSDMMQKLLTGMGVAVVAVTDAESGLEVLSTDRSFELILCDLRMPGMGGLAMLSEIESKWPYLSDNFVFITGDGISDDAKSIREKARHTIIEKPVSPNEFRKLIQSKKISQYADNNEVQT